MSGDKAGSRVKQGPIVQAGKAATPNLGLGMALFLCSPLWVGREEFQGMAPHHPRIIPQGWGHTQAENSKQRPLSLRDNEGDPRWLADHLFLTVT